MENSALVYYAQRGNKVAINELFEQHKNLLYKICKKYHNLYSYFLVWDEVENDGMNVFENSIHKFSYKYKASFATFLSLQLKYHFSSMARQNFTNKNIVNTFAIAKDYNEYTGGITASEKYNPHNKAIINDLYNRYISLLNKEEKKLILLWTQSYTYKEIAQIYNKRVKWVDNKINFIIKKLRKYSV